MHYPCDTAQRPSSIAGSCSSAHKLPPSPSMAAAAGFRWKCLYSGPLLYTDDRPILHCCWKGMWFIAVPSDITNMLLYKGEIILNSPLCCQPWCTICWRILHFELIMRYSIIRSKQWWSNWTYALAYSYWMKTSNYWWWCYQGRNIFFQDIFLTNCKKTWRAGYRKGVSSNL